MGELPPADLPARATSFLIDIVAPLMVLIAVLLIVGSLIADQLVILIVGAAGFLGLLAFVLWNSCYQQGVTGQSLGRRVAMTKLVTTEGGVPAGFGTALLRQICHGAMFGVGYLWPLWDERRQTVADKVVGTWVIDLNGRESTNEPPLGPSAASPR